jgi:hypothetical protein
MTDDNAIKEMVECPASDHPIVQEVPKFDNVACSLLFATQGRAKLLHQNNRYPV